MAQIYIQAPAPSAAPAPSWDNFPLAGPGNAIAPAVSPRDETPAPSDWSAFPEVKAPAAPPPPKGFIGSAVEAAQQAYPGYLSQQEAASQRTTPIMKAQEPNFLGPATTDEMGNVGYKDEQGNFVPTDINRHVLLTDPADRTPKVYARTPETSEGFLASTGRMLGTMYGPGNIQVSRAVPAAVQAAERVGVDLPKAIASEQPLTQFAGQVIAKAPGGGPLHEAIPASIEQLGGKVQQAGEMTGGVADRLGAGVGFKQGVENYFEPTVSKRIGELYGAVNKFIDPNATSQLTNTSALVDELNAARAARGKGPSSAVGLVQPALEKEAYALPSGNISAQQYQDFIRGQAAQPGLTYDAIKNLRTDVGEAIAKTPEGTSLTELKRLYKSLSQDLESHISQVGGEQAQVAFQRANAVNRTVEGWREILAPILGDEVKSGESIAASILGKASTGPQGDIRALTIARGAVPKEAWQDVAATAVAKLGRSTPEAAWSPAVFLSDYRKLSEPGKRLLFGSVGSGDVIPFLSDIADVSEKFAKAGKFANPSGTGGHRAFYTAMSTIFGGTVAAAVTGSLLPLAAPVAVVGGLVGNNVMARILATPATAASMARWTRAYQTVAERPTPAGLSALSRVSGEFAKTVNGAFGTKLTPETILRSTVQGPGTSQAGTNQENIPRPPGQ